MTVSTYRCKIKTEKACAQAQKSQVLTEQRLKYWFKLADPQTRNTFL
ncbi:DUF2057 family protein, partial [Escherichia coli]